PTGRWGDLRVPAPAAAAVAPVPAAPVLPAPSAPPPAWLPAARTVPAHLPVPAGTAWLGCPGWRGGSCGRRWRWGATAKPRPGPGLFGIMLAGGSEQLYRPAAHALLRHRLVRRALPLAAHLAQAAAGALQRGHQFAVEHAATAVQQLLQGHRFAVDRGQAVQVGMHAAQRLGGDVLELQGAHR